MTSIEEYEKIPAESIRSERQDLFYVIAHPMRRRLLKMIAEKEGGARILYIVGETKISIGALYFHLKALEGASLVAHNHHESYGLTEKGRTTLAFITEFDNELNSGREVSDHKVFQ